MTDNLTEEQRRYCMSRIRSKDTKPERILRSLLHSLGYRYRLHRKDLPGNPDLVFPGRSKVLLVHGCFWHRHNCRYGRVKPKTNVKYWDKKRESNVLRDRGNRKSLNRLGWDVLTIWECQILRYPETVLRRVIRFLGPR